MRSSTLPLRAAWKKLFQNALVLAALLCGLLIALRITGTLGPRSLRWMLPLGFVVMLAIPWVFLTKEGRMHLGLRRPKSLSGLAMAAAYGVAASFLCYAVGIALFGDGPDNWYVSIANSYRGAMNTTGLGLLGLHLVFTLPALLFSPIGEEIFFRGFLQDALEEFWSPRRSAWIEAGLFGLIHLCHHGVIITAGGVALRPVSGAIWVVLMTLTALLFAWLRRGEGSLAAPMAAHMAFNATMNVVIFATLWNQPS